MRQIQPRARGVSAQHGDFVTEQQNLGVLREVVPGLVEVEVAVPRLSPAVR
jgi:hypothetical protein